MMTTKTFFRSISLLSSDSSMGELVTGEQVIEWEALFLDKDKEYCWWFNDLRPWDTVDNYGQIENRNMLDMVVTWESESDTGHWTIGHHLYCFMDLEEKTRKNKRSSSSRFALPLSMRSIIKASAPSNDLMVLDHDHQLFPFLSHRRGIILEKRELAPIFDCSSINLLSFEPL